MCSCLLCTSTESSLMFNTAWITFTMCAFLTPDCWRACHSKIQRLSSKTIVARYLTHSVALVSPCLNYSRCTLTECSFCILSFYSAHVDCLLYTVKNESMNLLENEIGQAVAENTTLHMTQVTIFQVAVMNSVVTITLQRCCCVCSRGLQLMVSVRILMLLCIYFVSLCSCPSVDQCLQLVSVD